MKQKGRLQLDFYIILGIELLAIVLTSVLHLRFLTSTILFFAAPACYLFVRKPRPLHRIVLATLFFGGVLLFEMDFLAELNNVWVVNAPFITYKFFGIVTPEIIIWGLLWVFYILVFYEHFFETERIDTISSHLKYGILPATAAFIGILVIFLINPTLLTFNYSYFILGILSLSPFVFLAIRKTFQTPQLLVKFFKVSVFFFFVHLAHEFTALKYGQWYFPGNFIGTVNLSGQIIPIEEFFFWIMLSTSILLCYYEYFFDDGK